MKFGKRDKSIIDALFILALFGVFLICALFIVLFGAKIYKNTVKGSDDSFVRRTCYTYITEKIRQNDNASGVLIENDGDSSIVVLTKSVNDRNYTTYLYCFDGKLMEYTTTEGNELNKAAGIEIIDLDYMKASKINDNLYHFSLSGSDVDTSFYVSLSSDTTLGGVSNE